MATTFNISLKELQTFFNQGKKQYKQNGGKYCGIALSRNFSAVLSPFIGESFSHQEDDELLTSDHDILVEAIDQKAIEYFESVIDDAQIERIHKDLVSITPVSTDNFSYWFLIQLVNPFECNFKTLDNCIKMKVHAKDPFGNEFLESMKVFQRSVSEFISSIEFDDIFLSQF